MGISTAAIVAGIALAVFSFGQPVSATSQLGSTQVSAAATGGLMNKIQWSEIAVREIELATAPVVHDAIVGEATASKLHVQVARAADGQYIRLQWSDKQPDTSLGAIDRFADAVAVQFAVNGSTETPILMGDSEQPVNVWYWNAARQRAENLFAYGFGTLAPMEQQDILAQGKYENGQWAVVFRAPVATSPEEGGVDVSAPGGTPVAFAVWDGANQERDGFKAVSLDWERFEF